MAQQTQAARAAAYWERFLARFPTVEALAAATPADVLRGLGRPRLRPAGAGPVAGRPGHRRRARRPRPGRPSPRSRRCPASGRTRRGPWRRWPTASRSGRSTSTSGASSVGCVAGSPDGAPGRASMQALADASVPPDRPGRLDPRADGPRRDRVQAPDAALRRVPGSSRGAGAPRPGRRRSPRRPRPRTTSKRAGRPVPGHQPLAARPHPRPPARRPGRVAGSRLDGPIGEHDRRARRGRRRRRWPATASSSSTRPPARRRARGWPRADGARPGGTDRVPLRGHAADLRRPSRRTPSSAPAAGRRSDALRARPARPAHALGGPGGAAADRGRGDDRRRPPGADAGRDRGTADGARRHRRRGRGPGPGRRHRALGDRADRHPVRPGQQRRRRLRRGAPAGPQRRRRSWSAVVATEARPRNAASARNWDRIAGDVGIAKVHLPVARDVAGLRPGLEKAAVIVDALLGTGVRGVLREPIRSAVELIVQAARPGHPGRRRGHPDRPSTCPAASRPTRPSRPT